MGMSASQARLLSITARMNDVEFKSQSIANIKIRLADESEQLAMKYTKAISQQKYTYTTYKNGEAQKIDLTLQNLMQPDSKYRLVTSDGKVVLNSKEVTSINSTGALYYANFQNGVTEYGPNGFATKILLGYILQSDTDVEKKISDGTLDKNDVNYYKNLYQFLCDNGTKDSSDKITSFNYTELPGASTSDPAWLYNAIESGEFMLVDISTGANVTASNSVSLAIETDSSEFAKAEAEYNAANMKINNKEKLLDNELKKLDTEHNALSTEMDSIKNLIGNNIDKSFNLFG